MRAADLLFKVGGEENKMGKWEGDGGGEDGDENIGGYGEERVDLETGGVDKADWWGFGWFLLWREMVNDYPWEM